MAAPAHCAWLRLAALVVAAGVLGTLVHVLSPWLPGPAGAVFRRNVEHDIDATALIYSESGDVADYLDDEAGRYAAPAD
jgi:hypothetical protein